MLSKILWIFILGIVGFAFLFIISVCICCIYALIKGGDIDDD